MVGAEAALAFLAADPGFFAVVAAPDAAASGLFGWVLDKISGCWGDEFMVVFIINSGVGFYTPGSEATALRSVSSCVCV